MIDDVHTFIYMTVVVITITIMINDFYLSLSQSLSVFLDYLESCFLGFYCDFSVLCLYVLCVYYCVLLCVTLCYLCLHTYDSKSIAGVPTGRGTSGPPFPQMDTETGHFFLSSIHIGQAANLTSLFLKNSKTSFLKFFYYYVRF